MEERNMIILLIGNFIMEQEMKNVKIRLEVNKYATVIIAHDKKYYDIISEEDDKKYEDGVIRNYKTLIDLADNVVFFSEYPVDTPYPDELIRYSLLQNKEVYSNVVMNGGSFRTRPISNNRTYDGILPVYEIEPTMSCNIIYQPEAIISPENYISTYGIEEKLKKEYPGIFIRVMGNMYASISPLSDMTIIYNSTGTSFNDDIDMYLERVERDNNKERKVYFTNRYGLHAHIPVELLGMEMYKYNY